MPIEDALSLVNRFKDDELTDTIALIESSLERAKVFRVEGVNRTRGIDPILLCAVAEVKRASAQIDVIMHAVGILWALPLILQKDEEIVCSSLGAGKARAAGFDLETNLRIAEFKFIRWQGGSESVRKQTLFQDFYRLVREPTTRQKELYLLDTQIPLRFLMGRSSAVNILRRRNAALAEDYASRYGTRYKTVGEFYQEHKAEVRLVNLVEIAPEFAVFAAIVANESEGA